MQKFVALRESNPHFLRLMGLFYFSIYNIIPFRVISEKCWISDVITYKIVKVEMVGMRHLLSFIQLSDGTNRWSTWRRAITSAWNSAIPASGTRRRRGDDAAVSYEAPHCVRISKKVSYTWSRVQELVLARQPPENIISGKNTIICQRM